MFAAFNLFYGAGITINSLTLVGMALAVGMLLDNSIVVLENIYRLVCHAKRPVYLLLRLQVVLREAAACVWLAMSIMVSYRKYATVEQLMTCIHDRCSVCL